MPNTPAAVGRGITAIVGNAQCGAASMELAEDLLSAVGQVVRLDNEGQMDAVTALSGSGPAYVFHLIEAMAAAGEAEGLPSELALQLAQATVAGAGQLAEDSDETPSQLRVNVTSPGGTTAAALAVLMDDADGLPPLMRRAVAAAAARSRELGRMSGEIDFDHFPGGRHPRRPDHPGGTVSRGAQARDQAVGRFRRRAGRAQELGADHRHYRPQALIGRQVLAVVNFPPRQIGKFMSEVLVLGVPDDERRGGADRSRQGCAAGRAALLERVAAYPIQDTQNCGDVIPCLGGRYGGRRWASHIQ